VSYPFQGRSAVTKALQIGLVLLILWLGAWAARLWIVGFQHTPQRSIMNNLRIIQMKKELWAADNKKTGEDTPTEADLVGYFNSGRIPSSAIGETYRINPVGKSPAAVVPMRIRYGTKVIEAGGEINWDDTP
jgi:hypothetical protein